MRPNDAPPGRLFTLADVQDAVDELIREDDYTPEQAQRRIGEILRDCASVEVVPRSEAEALAEALEAFTTAYMRSEDDVFSSALSAALKTSAVYRERHPKECEHGDVDCVTCATKPPPDLHHPKETP